MPDSTIIKMYFPGCVTWKDVVLWSKRNLNLRTIEVHHFWSVPQYENVVWFTELVTLFERCGLTYEESCKLVVDLSNMGFLTAVDEIKKPRRDWVMDFLI